LTANHSTQRAGAFYALHSKWSALPCGLETATTIAKKLIALVKAGERNPDICAKTFASPNSGPPQKRRGLRSWGSRSSVRNTAPPEALPRRPPFTLQLRHGGRNPATTLAQWRGFSFAGTGQAFQNGLGVAP